MADLESLVDGKDFLESRLRFINETDAANNCTPVEEFADLLKVHSDRQVGVTVTYGFICGVGLIANAAVLFLLLVGGRKGATYKAPSTLLILNLAIADTLFLLTLPFAISHRIQKHWNFGVGMCKFEEGVKFLNYYASVFFITAMAVDRYLVLTRPAVLNRKLARKYMLIVTGVLWILALIAVIPLMVFASVDEFGSCTIIFPTKPVYVHNLTAKWETVKNIKCLEDYINPALYEDYQYEGEGLVVIDDKKAPGSGEETYDDTYYDLPPFNEEEHKTCKHPNIPSLHKWLIWNFVIGFVVPFLIITACYVRMMMLRIPHISSSPRLRKTEVDSANNNIVINHNQLNGGEAVSKLITNTSPTTRISSQKNRAKILMEVLVPCLIFAFAACWLPYHAFHLAKINGVHMDSLSNCNVVRDITFCLAFFNSVLNPILNSFFLLKLFKQRLHQSSSWVSGRLKTFNLMRKGKKDVSSMATLRGVKKTTEFEDANAAEMTVMTLGATEDV